MALLNNIHDALRDKSNPYTQFAKYVFCGGISVVVDMAVFYLLAWLVFPCLKAGDPAMQILEWMGFSIRQVPPEIIVRNYWIIKGFCFFASNATVYILNVLYVFESGKHRRHHEVLLFFSISLFVFLGGTWLGTALIKYANWYTTYAYLFVLALGVVSNYALRKFLVFKR